MTSAFKLGDLVSPAGTDVARPPRGTVVDVYGETYRIHWLHEREPETFFRPSSYFVRVELTADLRVEQVVTSYLNHPVTKTAEGVRGAWRLAAAYCRRHGIETLRADHENRTPGNEWRPTTSRDICNRHMQSFRVNPEHRS